MSKEEAEKLGEMMANICIKMLSTFNTKGMTVADFRQHAKEMAVKALCDIKEK